MNKQKKKIKLIMILSGLVVLGLAMLLWTKTEFTGVQPETIELYSTYEEHFKSSMQNRADFDAKLREQFLALENLIEEAKGKGGDA